MLVDRVCGAGGLGHWHLHSDEGVLQDCHITIVRFSTSQIPCAFGTCRLSDAELDLTYECVRLQVHAEGCIGKQATNCAGCMCMQVFGGKEKEATKEAIAEA